MKQLFTDDIAARLYVENDFIALNCFGQFGMTPAGKGFTEFTVPHRDLYIHRAELHPNQHAILKQRISTYFNTQKEPDIQRLFENFLEQSIFLFNWEIRYERGIRKHFSQLSISNDFESAEAYLSYIGKNNILIQYHPEVPIKELDEILVNLYFDEIDRGTRPLLTLLKTLVGPNIHPDEARELYISVMREDKSTSYSIIERFHSRALNESISNIDRLIEDMRKQINTTYETPKPAQHVKNMVINTISNMLQDEIVGPPIQLAIQHPETRVVIPNNHVVSQFLGKYISKGTSEGAAGIYNARTSTIYATQRQEGAFSLHECGFAEFNRTTTETLSLCFSSTIFDECMHAAVHLTHPKTGLTPYHNEQEQERYQNAIKNDQTLVLELALLAKKYKEKAPFLPHEKQQWDILKNATKIHLQGRSPEERFVFVNLPSEIASYGNAMPGDTFTGRSKDDNEDVNITIVERVYGYPTAPEGILIKVSKKKEINWDNVVLGAIKNAKSEWINFGTKNYEVQGDEALLNEYINRLPYHKWGAEITRLMFPKMTDFYEEVFLPRIQAALNELPTQNNLLDCIDGECHLPSSHYVSEQLQFSGISFASNTSEFSAHNNQTSSGILLWIVLFHIAKVTTCWLLRNVVGSYKLSNSNFGTFASRQQPTPMDNETPKEQLSANSSHTHYYNQNPSIL